MSKCNCPDEVQWQEVNLRLQKDMTRLELRLPQYCAINVPDHLIDNGIQQYEVTAYFKDIQSVANTLETFALNWNGVSYDILDHAARAEGGVVFRREGRSGYFVLKQPCLLCCIKIGKQCNDDIQILKRACVTCWLSFQD